MFKYFLSFCVGAISAFAFAPYYYVFLLFFTFPVFQWLLYKSQSLKQSFITGYCFGFGYFLSGLYWISYSLTFELELFAWLIPIAILGIPSILAIYIAAFSSLTFFYRKHPRAWFSLMFIATWVIVEISRAYLFTGFPWLTIGYVTSNWLAFTQSSSLLGVYILSILVLLIASVPFVYEKRKPYIALKYLTCCVVLMSANIIFGTIRLYNNPTEFTEVKIGVVQPNISQNIKGNEYLKWANFDAMLKASAIPELRDVKFLVWPEAAIAYSFENPRVLELVKKVIPKDGYLIAGGIRVDAKNNTFWNSSFVIDDQGKHVAYYDKIHLVPFGEYTPFRKWVDLRQIHGAEGLTEGVFTDNINLNALPSLRILICYESFFPHELKSKRPDFFVNITNDAWFKQSPGPYQHFDITRFRAIESGVPLVRAANTGISAIIDPVGRVLDVTFLDKSKVLVNFLPKPVALRTMYSMLGDTIMLLAMVVFVVYRVTFINV